MEACWGRILWRWGFYYFLHRRGKLLGEGSLCGEGIGFINLEIHRFFQRKE
jgi:hypothetical protein